MNLSAVRDELGLALANIPGLNIIPDAAGAVSAPAAVVGLPEQITYHGAYARGMDTMTIPVMVLVARPHSGEAVRAAARYADGSGPYSVRAALEAGTYRACDDVTVTQATTDIITYGGVDYLALDFSVEVAGSGSET